VVASKLAAAGGPSQSDAALSPTTCMAFRLSGFVHDAILIAQRGMNLHLRATELASGAPHHYAK
jgi:hypothetical protein